MQTVIKKKLRKAFTLLEVIFVMVILGIVASINSSIIADVYESYITQKALHKTSLKTELAIEQLSNRLSSRFALSIVAKEPANPNNWVKLTEYTAAADAQKTALEWISYDEAGFNANAWSGFTDLNASVMGTISTPASNLNLANTIMQNLNGPGAGAAGFNGAGIIFNGQDEYRNGVQYTAECMNMGYDGNFSCIGTVTQNGLTNINIASNPANTPGQMRYGEFYQLANSAFAVVPVASTNPLTPQLFDLTLFYNYRPWLGETFNAGARTQSAVLLRNVSVFRFQQTDDSIRLKICVTENIGDTYDISICKEKAVIR